MRNAKKLNPASLCAILSAAALWMSHAHAVGQARSDLQFQDLLRQGFALHQQGQYASALLLLQRALKVEPNDYYANLLVGIDLLRTGEPKTALTYLSTASRVQPTADIPLDYIVEADATLHRYADAAKASARAVAVAPASEEAVEASAGFALERFRTLSSEMRSTVDGLAAERRLEALSRALTDPERLHLLQSSASLDPNAPGIWKDLAKTDEAQGHIAERSSDPAHARDLDRPAVAQAGSSVASVAFVASTGQQWLRSGESFVDARRWTDASVALEHALEADPGLTYARYLLCWTYAQQSSDIVRLLESRQESDVVHRIRGDVLLRIHGDGKAAAEEYTAALRTHSGDPALLERLAEAQLRAGETAAAVQSAQAALRQDPHRWSALQTLAEVDLQQRRYGDAIPYLRQLQGFDPSNAAVRVELGTALASTGDAAGAVPLLSSVLQQGYPDQKGSLHALLGTALRKTGRDQDATEAFAIARKLSDRYQQSDRTSVGSDE